MKSGAYGCSARGVVEERSAAAQRHDEERRDPELDRGRHEAQVERVAGRDRERGQREQCRALVERHARGLGGALPHESDATPSPSSASATAPRPTPRARARLRGGNTVAISAPTPTAVTSAGGGLMRGGLAR